MEVKSMVVIEGRSWNWEKSTNRESMGHKTESGFTYPIEVKFSGGGVMIIEGRGGHPIPGLSYCKV